MIQSKTEILDGVSFTTTQLPAMRAYPLFIRLLKTIGPALGALSRLKPEDDLSGVMPQLAGALTSLEPQAAEAIALEVLSTTTATLTNPAGQAMVIGLSSPTNMDIVFSGRIKLMFQAIGFAIRVNYADFFGGATPSAPLLPTA